MESLQKELKSILPGVVLQQTPEGEYLGVLVLATEVKGYIPHSTISNIKANLITHVKDGKPYQELGQKFDDARLCIAEQEREIKQLNSNIDLLKGILIEQLIKTTTE